MKYVISDANAGGLSLLLMHAVFNEHESITHYMHEFDKALYRELPYLYVVCLAETIGTTRKIRGGFFIKTSYSHESKEFADMIMACIESTPDLSNIVNNNIKILPAKVKLNESDGIPITESEMLSILAKQALKHEISGIC